LDLGLGWAFFLGGMLKRGGRGMTATATAGGDDASDAGGTWARLWRGGAAEKMAARSETVNGV